MASQPEYLKPTLTGGSPQRMYLMGMRTGGNQPPEQVTTTMQTGGNQPPVPQTTAPPPAGGQWQEQVPTALPTNSPIAIMDWRSRLREGNTDAMTRQVGDNELVANQLNALTATNSRYLQQARDRANNEASARGMLMSSVAIGNSQRAAIDAAMPIAQADAATYGRTASENMAAVNQDRLADQNMWGQLTGQEVGIRANLDESERARGFTARENALGRNFQSFERVSGQQWQSGENSLNRQWQQQENALQRAWQGAQNDTQRQHELTIEEQRRAHEAAQRELDRNFTGSQNERQFAQQRFLSYAQMMENQNKMLADTISAIYNNPNLNAAQQAAAVQNARAMYQSLFTSYANAMSGGVPQIFWNPYPMAAPATTTPPPTQPPPTQPPPTQPRPDGGGGVRDGGDGLTYVQQRAPATSGYSSPRTYIMDNARYLMR